MSSSGVRTVACDWRQIECIHRNFNVQDRTDAAFMIVANGSATFVMLLHATSGLSWISIRKANLHSCNLQLHSCKPYSWHILHVIITHPFPWISICKAILYSCHKSLSWCIIHVTYPFPTPVSKAIYTFMLLHSYKPHECGFRAVYHEQCSEHRSWVSILNDW